MAFRRRVSLVALSVAALFVVGSAQAQYSGIVTFGDSLSDGGTYGSKFTTNPGSVWVELLASQLGLTLTPWTKGGTNFAQGGARVSQSPGITPVGAAERPVSTQITQYLTANGGKVASGSLVTLWAGANDIFVNLDAAGKGLITSAQVQGNIQQAASDLVTQVGRLRAAGAGTIVVVNLPDMGITPLGLNAGAANKATFTALSGLYNTVLNLGLAQVGGNVISVNAYGLISEIAASPSTYGFTNVTTPACKTDSSITCSPADLRDPNAAKTWLFADTVHPTTGGHAALASVVAATMRAPSQISILPEAATNAVRAQVRVLEQRARATDAGSPLGVFINADFGKNSLAKITDMETTAFTIGMDRRFGAINAGAAIGVNTTKSDLLGGNGSFKLEQPTINFFANTARGNHYMGGNVFFGDLRFTDVTRAIAIGSALRNEVSSTGGSQAGLGVYGGMWLPLGAWQHGPVVRLDYSNATVKAFAEPGTSSTALAFGRQRREQALASLGWQIASTFGGGGLTYSPYAKIAYEHDFRASARSVSASTVSMAGSSFSMTGIAPNESQVLVEAGINARMNGLNLGLSITGGTARDSGSYSAVNVTLRMPL
jgi:outer membrane lipase/esterase